MAKEKMIVNIRFGFEEAPAEIDLKKLTSAIAYNYLINCNPGPIAWIEVTAENKETKETGVYRYPFRKGETDNA